MCCTLSVHCSLIQGLIQFPAAACAGTSGAGVSLPSEWLRAAGSPQPAGPNGAGGAELPLAAEETRLVPALLPPRLHLTRASGAG